MNSTTKTVYNIDLRLESLKVILLLTPKICNTVHQIAKVKNYLFMNTVRKKLIISRESRGLGAPLLSAVSAR